MPLLSRKLSLIDTLSEPAAPSYSAVEAAPPAFQEFPANFRVNGADISPLVNTVALKQHLKLLGAFHALKQQVVGLKTGLGCTEGLSEEARWSVFVCMASTVLREDWPEAHMCCSTGRPSLRALY